MSFYQWGFRVMKKVLKPSTVFKVGFNIAPMYRRTAGRVTEVSDDLHRVVVRIPLNYKTRNYVGAIFGGSLFSSTDPIYMIQLLEILGNDFVVWDKAATIRYRRPAREKVYAIFEFSKEEIESIRSQVDEKKEIDVVKNLTIETKNGQVVAELEKVIYIADKSFYKEKLARKKAEKPHNQS